LKISEAIANFISQIGTRKVFGVSGGASLHLLNAVRLHSNLELICLHHEQSVAMAAEAYSRLTNEVGVGIATSGPGATNLITGIAGAFYDSVPCIYLTGQVSVNRGKGSSGVRQRGFQETPIVEMVREITKFSVSIKSPDEVIPALIEAHSIATTGRMGPVLIDIPDDIQRMEFTEVPNLSESFRPLNLVEDFGGEFEKFFLLLRNASKPVIVLGSGLRFSTNRDYVIEILKNVSIPVTTTWGAKDMVADTNPALLGTFGTHGSRFANTIINESDLIISFGSRLDLKATGSPVNSFAPNSMKVMLDIDSFELRKFEGSGMKIDLPLCINLNSNILRRFLNELISLQSEFHQWGMAVQKKRQTFPLERRSFSGLGVNPYDFIEALSDVAPASLDVIVDTGCAIAWTMQSWKVKIGQNIIHDFNNTAMGWSIPGTIASIYSSGSEQTYCIVGDGSIMMSLGELANIRDVGKRVKIFLLNNNGYAMIKQTQDQWFAGDYFASDAGRDLIFPNFRDLAKAFGFDYSLIESNSELNEFLSNSPASPGITFCEIKIQKDARVVPIVKFGNPNHLMEPDI
jgi:acetolactate synthase-1/2/3 large subunit